jgi:hypothetical protein
MELIRGWDSEELSGNEVATPAPGVKWNQLGLLYQGFYDRFAALPLAQLIARFRVDVDDFIRWVGEFSEDEVFSSGGRKWASSTPSDWPIWKWIHINTVAPFKSFRGKIRKWKKIRNG